MRPSNSARYLFGSMEPEDNIQQFQHKFKKSEVKDYSLIVNQLKKSIEHSQENLSKQIKYTQKKLDRIQKELETTQDHLTKLNEEQLKNNQYISIILENFLKEANVISNENIKEINNHNQYLNIKNNYNSVFTKSHQARTNLNQNNFPEEENNRSQSEKHSQINIYSFVRKPEDLNDLLNNYNSKTAKVLLSYVTKVDSTPESIEGKRSGKKIPMIFTAIANGIYWLVNQPALQDSHNFLVPKAGLVINDANYQTLEAIFKCDGYENRTSNKFQLISPAIVNKLSLDRWQLIESGKLMF